MTEAQALVRRWTEPTGTLGELIASTRQRIAEAAGTRATIERKASSRPVPPSLLHALDRPTVGVIAEIKRRSPSKGDIAPQLDAPARAQGYEAGGAAALSVLTEPSRFGGTLQDLEAVTSQVRIPVLRKDFIVDELQIAEARAYGASGVLLIARALPPDRLAILAAEARAQGLEPLIEIRSEAELEAALRADGKLIGVNTRNLETLEVDAGVAERLLPMVPREVIAVYESGVKSRDDVEHAAALGARAVLVGGWLSSQTDASAGVRLLSGVPVSDR